MAVNYTPFIQQALQIQKQGLEKRNNRFKDRMDSISQMAKTVGDLREQREGIERRKQKDKIAAEEREIKNQDRLRNQRIQDSALIKNNFESEMDLDMKTLDRFPPGSPAYDRALEAIKKKQRGFNENYQNYLMKGGDVESLIGGNKQKNPFEPGSSMYEGMEKYLAKQAGKAGLKPKTEEQQELEKEKPKLLNTIKKLNTEVADLDHQLGENITRWGNEQSHLKQQIGTKDRASKGLKRRATDIMRRMDHTAPEDNPLERLNQALHGTTLKDPEGFLSASNINLNIEPGSAKSKNMSNADRILRELEAKDPALVKTFLSGLGSKQLMGERKGLDWNIDSINALPIDGEEKEKLTAALQDPEIRNLLKPKTRDYTRDKRNIGFIQGHLGYLEEDIKGTEEYISDINEKREKIITERKTKEDARILAEQTSRKVDAGIKDLQSARNYDYYNTSLGFGYDASEVGASAENLTKRIELGYTTERNRLERVRDAKLKTVTTEADKTEIRKQFNTHLGSLDKWKAGQLPIAQQGMQVQPAPTFDDFGLTAEDSANAVESDLRTRSLPTLQGLIKEATTIEQLEEVKETLKNSAYNDNDREIAETLIENSETKIIENQRQLDVKSDKTIATKGFKSSDEYTSFVESINRKQNYTTGEQQEILAEAQASFLTDRLGTQAKDRKTAEILLTEATEGASNMNADPSARTMAASQLTTGLIKRINPGLTNDQAKSIAQSTRKNILSNVAQKQADAIATLGGGNTPGRDENGKPNWVASIENLNLGPEKSAIAVKKARDNRYQQNKETAKDLMKVLGNGNLSQTTRDKARAQLSALYQDDKISVDDWKQANFNAEITSELGKKAEAKEILDIKVKHNLPLTDKEISSAFKEKPKLQKVWKKGYEGQMAKTHLLAAVSRGDRSAVEKWAKDNPGLVKQVEEQYGITVTGPGNVLDEADQANMKSRLIRQKQGKEMLHSSIKHLIDPSTGKFRSDKGLEDVLKDNNIDLEDMMKNIGLSTLGTVQTADQAKAYLEAIYSPKPLTKSQKEDQTYKRIRAAKSYYGFRWDMMTAPKRAEALNNFMTGVLPSLKMSDNIQPTTYKDDISVKEVQKAMGTNIPTADEGGVDPPRLNPNEGPSLDPGQLLGPIQPPV